MIPAIFGAVKALTLAQKAIGAGIIVAILGGTYGLGWLKGVASCENKQAHDILAQALDVGKHEAAKAETLAKVEEQHDVKERQTDKQAQVVTHEIIKYVEKTKPIELDPRYRELLDRVQQLQRDAENRVSEAHTPAPEIDEVRAYKITTNQLLLAYNELSNARGKDLGMIEYCKAFEVNRYNGEMAFYDNLPATARADE